jgi:4'-phosphopantetheinyl transferase
LIKLDSGVIDLWCVFFDEIQEPKLLAEYLTLLSDAEKLQMQRFYFAHDRRRYLLTRALVRVILSRHVNIKPEYLVFTTNAHGKPEIMNAQGRAHKISFNISHTKSIIVLGVTCENHLGVDVESITTRPAPLEVADRYFSHTEAAHLKALAPGLQHQRFFQLWTLKESYIKARGMGLSIPLNQFEFDFQSDGSINMNIHHELNDHPRHWHFWQCQPHADYLMAVCAQNNHSSPQQLILRKLIPLREETLLNPLTPPTQSIPAPSTRE